MILKAYLNNVECVSPIELGDISFDLSFGQMVQPDIESKTFTFVLEDKVLIDAWIFSGRIYEGIPFSISIIEGESTHSLFFILDLNTYEEIDRQQCEVTVKVLEGLNQLDNRINGITFGLLENKGVITESDYSTVAFIVEKESTILERALLALSIYIIFYQIETEIKNQAESATTDVAIGASNPVTGPSIAVAAALKAAKLIMLGLYYGLLIVQLKKMIEELISLFFAPIRKHKSIRFSTAFEKIAQYLGYSFQTGIDAMSKEVYLPSNQGADGVITKGIPNVSDYGYRINEFFELANQKWNTKVAVIDGVLHVRNVDDSFWERQASFEITEVEEMESFRYNNNDLIGSYILEFETDLSDVWTINNIDGTMYGVKVLNQSIQNERADLINGFERISIPLALGNEKKGLNAVETTLRELGGLVDDLTGIFKGGTNFRSQIKSRIGMLKVSTQFHVVPKNILLSGQKLATNHRAILNAKNQFESYHRSKSFVKDSFKNQAKVHENKTVPFAFSDFLKVVKTNRAKFKGKTVEITKLAWNADQDTAVISFEEPFVFTRNLIENFTV